MTPRLKPYRDFFYSCFIYEKFFSIISNRFSVERVQMTVWWWLSWKAEDDELSFFTFDTHHHIFILVIQQSSHVPNKTFNKYFTTSSSHETFFHCRTFDNDLSDLWLHGVSKNFIFPKSVFQFYENKISHVVKLMQEEKNFSLINIFVEDKTQWNKTQFGKLNLSVFPAKTESDDNASWGWLERKLEP